MRPLFLPAALNVSVNKEYQEMAFLFWAGIIFTIVAPVYIGIQYDDPSTSWVAALCGAFVSFMAKIENIAELSLGPVKAKMKQEIKEAAATTEHLKAITTVTSEGFLTDLMAGNFMGGMKLDKRFELHDKVINALNEIGATPEQIARVENNWKKGVAIIYHRTIKKTIEEREHPNKVNPNAPQNAKDAGKEIQDLLNFSEWEAPAPHVIRTVIEKYDISSPEAEKWISDYENFLLTGEIRNREEFLKQ